MCECDLECNHSLINFYYCIVSPVSISESGAKNEHIEYK